MAESCYKLPFIQSMESMNINLDECIMRSFFDKKSLVIWLSDTHCRNIILSLHFFILEFLWNDDRTSLGVSLQKKTMLFTS